MKSVAFLIMLLNSLPSYGQSGYDQQMVAPNEETESSGEADINESTPKTEAERYPDNYGWFGKLTEASRRESNFTFNATPYSLGFILPGKVGASGGYIVSQNWTIEPEFFHGEASLGWKGINFAKFSESYFLLPFKWYPGTNSLFLNFGAGRRDYKIELGDAFLAKATNAPVSAKGIEVQTYILDLGIGNRWQFENGVTLSLNWLELFIPIGFHEVDAPFLNYVEDDDTRRRIKQVINILKDVPTFAFLKAQIGYTF